MSYIDRELIFENDKIYFISDGINVEVMMDWEDSLMMASANYVCENGGDILEIGFGMGISANYIQSNNINSHTIVENHPDILPRLRQWSLDKPNVIIIEGSWFDNLNILSTYDGIFYDTFGDPNMYNFGEELPKFTKSGTKVTWWNNLPEENNNYGITGVTYQSHTVNPPQNSYFNNTTYYLPKKQY